MWQWLQHLAAQQTTAPELATFLLLVTVACIVASGATYAVIMTIAWWATLRTKYSWFRVMFPNVQMLREHAGEYLLAGLTSVILTMTLAEKDALVDTVLQLPASAYVDNPVVAHVFPLGRLPTTADLKGPSFRDEVLKVSSTDLSGLVHGPLEAGRSEGVRAVFVDAAKSVLARPSVAARVATLLKLLCIGLMAIYVIWLSSRRVEALKATEDSGGLQKEVAGRLVVLGVCLALLLANPLGNPNAELLADSAMSAARIAPVTTPRLDSLAVRSIQNQTAFLAAGTVNKDDTARGAVVQLAESLAAANRRLLALESSIDARFQAVSVDDRQAAERLKSLAVVVDSMKQRALLLVIAGTEVTYTVQGQASKFAEHGTGVGLFWMPPGEYLLTPLKSKGVRVSLKAGQSLAVTAPLR